MRTRKLVVWGILGAMALSLCGCSNKVEQTPVIDDQFVQAVVSYNDDNWEVKTSSKAEPLVIYKDGKQTSITTTKCNGKDLLTLPESKNSKDILEAEVIAENTYKTGLQDSADYIKYLTEQGYEIVYRADTYKFIELYLKSNKDLYYKRVIVSDEYTVAYDTDNIPEVNINDYIFD